MAGWRVGIDIGGTFTDIIVMHDGGEAPRSTKVPTRAADPVGSITAALTAVMLIPEEVQELIHSTTRVTTRSWKGGSSPSR